MTFANAGVWGPIDYTNSQGTELLGTLTVYTDSARTIKATLYTDTTKATTAPNPVSPDTLGNFTVYATPGLYYGTFTHGGTTTNTLVNVVPLSTDIAQSQPAEGTNVQMLALQPFTAATPPFTVLGSSAQFNSTWDQLMILGYNAGAGAGARIAGQPAWYQQFEFNYNNGTANACEWHIDYTSANGSVTNRPFQISADRTTNTASGSYFLFDVGTAPSGSFTNTFNINSGASQLLTLSTTLFSNFTAVELQGTTGQAGSNTLTIGNNSTAVDSQIIFNPPASNPAALIWNQSNAGVWKIYQLGGDTHLYFRDLANSAMLLTFTPGASSTARTAEINASLKVDGNLGFYGTTPIAKPSATGSATGYAAGATAVTFHSDDTYTGNTGSTAYTINGVVAALKNLGLLTA